MERLYFIVNPIAGAGRSAKLFEQVRVMLKERGVNFDVAATEFAGHATRLAQEALAAGERRIIAVGGDGTVNEVASALCGSGAVMGILPFGTGNDLSRTLSLPAEPKDALDVILGGHVRHMDAGMANDRLFFNVAGYGFDVDVLVRAQKFKKRFNGMLPYMLGVIETMFHLRKLNLRVTTEKEILELEGIIIIVGNGRFFGGGMMSTPKADPFDGQFDICLVKNMPVRRYIPVLSRVVKGTHLDLPEVMYFRADSLTVECPQGGLLELDGEICAGVPVRFRMLAGAIPLLVRP